MKKLITRVLSLMLTVALLAPIPNNVIAADTQGGDLLQYSPYSEWSESVGFKYNLIFKEKPQRGLLRWEVVNVLYSVAELENSKKAESRKNVLNDINPVPKKAADRIAKVYSMGMINGYEDNSFKPFNTITRAEFVKFCDNFEMLTANIPIGGTAFSDITGHWAERSIEKAVAQGLVKGKSESLFAPEDSITVEEILVILDRLATVSGLSSSVLTSSLTDTFNAQVYSEDEKSFIESLYSGVMKATQDMEVYSIAIPEYDYSKIDDYITLEEVLICMYYFIEGMYGTLPSDVDKRMEYIQSERLAGRVYGRVIKETEGRYFKSYAYLEEVLIALESLIQNAHEKASFSNMNILSEELKKALNSNVSAGIIGDSKNEFKLKEKVTKGIFNNLILKYSEISNIKSMSWSDIFPEIGEKGSIDFDRAAWPYNYSEYPFIYRPLDNSVYEMVSPFQQREDYRNPRETFVYWRIQYPSMRAKVEKYFDIILNVDYNTIEVTQFQNSINPQTAYNYEIDLFSPYVDHVKENKIKISGKAEPCMPIVYFDGWSFRMRVKLDFTIESADTNVNLVFGDVFISKRNIVYKQNQYSMYVEVEFDSTLNGFKCVSVDSLSTIRTIPGDESTM